jgi:hypothetical protein
LSEDYCTVHVLPQPGVTAAAFLTAHASEIAQIIRGERHPLSPDEQGEILQHRLSYYPNDVVVAGWSAAFVYDTAEGAATAFPLIEYANSQLLEYRHYDTVLTATLERAYDRVQAAAGFLERLRLGRQADQLNGLVIEVRELTERTDTAIKFLSDMFSARLYRLLATRVGVPDYRKLVDDKLQTATDLYHFMVEQRNHRRALVLEGTVVIILIIELFFLLRGEVK